MNDNQHISQKDLLDYILRNEYRIGEDPIRLIENHISNCEICSRRYRLFLDRYPKVQILPEPDIHLLQIRQNMKEKTRNMHMPSYLKAAAGIGFIFILYGSTVWWMNYRFDHGESGLAGVEKDYEYALKEEHYRGDGYVEREDIKIFKKGVRLLFEAKETSFGFFPEYNGEKIMEAENTFQTAFLLTQDELLKRKITQFRLKIEFMKKEIRK
jgi:hypothetical protein